MSISRILLVLLAGGLFGSGTVESLAYAEPTEALSIVVLSLIHI